MVDISGAGIKRTVLIKKVKKQKSNQVLLLQIVLTYLLPSVVDVSEAGIQRTVVISKNRFKNKNQIKYYIFKQC